jgi:hypothetical protein
VVKTMIEKITIEFGHSKKQLKEVADDDCWDFPIEELFDGSVEPQNGKVYWFIGGRLYETNL